MTKLQAECKHKLERKDAWNYAGTYITCANCNTTVHAPGIYNCMLCSMLVCSVCAVTFEQQKHVDAADADSTDTIDLDLTAYED